MIDGPDTKYKMLWRGEWRAVTHMLDHHNTPTTLAVRAAKVVLYVGDYGRSGWTACSVTPGDLIERTDRNPNAREWDYID